MEGGGTGNIDDSFEHETWNNSEEDRVVLMFDIPNELEIYARSNIQIQNRQ